MRKNFLLILFIFATISANINSQEYYEGEYEFAFGEIPIAEGLTLFVNEDNYRIEYEIPQHYEDYVIVNDEIYSVIKFENDNDFFEMREIGLPNLPFKSLNLQIPFDIPYIDHIVDYEVYYEEFEEHHLAYPYFPAQDTEKEQVYPNLNLDINYGFYESNEWYYLVDGGVEISEPYYYCGSAGVTVNLYPVAYNPIGNTARIPSRIIVEFPNLSLDQLTVCQHSLFDTYWHDYSTQNRTKFKGDLAIFTHSNYVSALSSYVQYKRNCGYRVNVYTDTTNWSNPVVLRNKIKEIYDESDGQNLDYVLIVGAPIQIPYSVGILNNPRPISENIPTDIYYACLEQNNINNEPLTPDIKIGRWPVTSEQEVINITEKTIRFEETFGRIYHSAGRTALFSGTGDYAYWFDQDINTFANILRNYNLSATTYDGRGYTNDEMFYLLNDELNSDLWMMIYSGHGSPSGIGITDYTQINQLAYSDVSPISFFFACSTNRYPNSGNNENYTLSKTFAMQWVVEQNKGGVASLGSTTTTQTYTDHHFGKAIFKQLKRSDTNMHIADWIQSSAQRYCNAYWRASYAKNQFKRYVLMGDPTLYIYGTNSFDNPIIRYSKQSEDEDKEIESKKLVNFEIYPTIANDHIIVNTSECIESLQITNLSGKIVYNDNNVIDNTIISTSSLPESIYFVIAQTKEGKVLNKKLIVQH